MVPVQVFRRKLPGGGLSPTWYFRAETTGRRYRKSTGPTDKAKAQAFARKRVEQLKSKRSAQEIASHFPAAFNDTEPVTVSDAWELFLRAPKKKRLAARTIQNRRSRWDHFVNWLAQNHPGCKTLDQCDGAQALSEREAHARLHQARLTRLTRPSARARPARLALSPARRAPADEGLA